MELVDIETPVDVAVIDEMQMLSDPDRGAAWTRAILGVQAAEVHLAGDPAAIDIVRTLVDQCGDEMEIRRYERLSPLSKEARATGGDFSKIRPGDCVVAFSRQDIYAIRKEIETATQLKCCVIYGSLPPEARSTQARLFNDRDSGYDVLVASDAIGMGLNLNIRRIVFSTVEKFDGVRRGPAPIALIKQIAGRAGRKSSQWPEGYYTAFAQKDLEYIHSCMGQDTPALHKAGIFPTSLQLQMFSRHIPSSAHSDIGGMLQVFVEACRLDDQFFMCSHRGIDEAARMLAHIDALTLEDRFKLSSIPVSLGSQRMGLSDQAAYFVRCVERLCLGDRIRLDIHLPLKEEVRTPQQLQHLESRAAALNVYGWLARKYPLHMPDGVECEVLRVEAVRRIEGGLEALSDEIAFQRRRQQRRDRGFRQGASKRGVGAATGGSGGKPRARSRTRSRPRARGGAPAVASPDGSEGEGEHGQMRQ